MTIRRGDQLPAALQACNVASPQGAKAFITCFRAAKLLTRLTLRG